jgi:O-antigen ligase
LSDAAAHSLPAVPRRAIGSLGFWRNVALWTLVASAWLVIVEPAPYELIFALTLLLFLPGGLKVPLISLPFVTALALYNLGGAVGLEGATDDRISVMFTVISYYMAVTGMFFCFLVTTETNSRMAIIRNAYVTGAVIASILGILGYFDVAGLGAQFAENGRVNSTFKDPNVFAPFLIPPFIFLAQDMLLGKARRPFLALIAMLAIALALFLAFSRGAWGNAVLSGILLVVLTLLLAPNPALRRRVILMSISGAVLFGLGTIAALQVPAISRIFEVRASLNQAYDVGETGRFGNQIASIPGILTQPQGMNPRHFRYIFGHDPHNVFLNAFASYGWLGGFSFFTLVIMTFWAGWRAIRIRTPWQHHAIAIYCPLAAVLVQGVQIDTDHWRHLYLLLGCMWGLLGATLDYEGQMRRRNQGGGTANERLD